MSLCPAGEGACQPGWCCSQLTGLVFGSVSSCSEELQEFLSENSASSLQEVLDSQSTYYMWWHLSWQLGDTQDNSTVKGYLSRADWQEEMSLTYLCIGLCLRFSFTPLHHLKGLPRHLSVLDTMRSEALQLTMISAVPWHHQQYSCHHRNRNVAGYVHGPQRWHC